MPNAIDSTTGGAFSSEQLRNARIIIQVGTQLGASKRDIRIALMTALQESGLRNLDYGDRDSIGLFQQRDAWGTREQRLDPAESARMFFKGGHAGQRGLFDFSDRDSMSLSQAAQSVQVSAYPDAYAKWHEDALNIINQVGLGGGGGGGPKAPSIPAPTAQDASGTGYQDVLQAAGVPQSISEQLQPVAQSILGIDPAGLGSTQAVDDFSEVSSAMMPTYASPKEFQQAAGGKTTGGWRQDLVQYAKQFIGTPYVWGGTSPDGFDCSGLTQYVYKHFGIDLPRISADQGRVGRRVSLADAKPGDLILWNNSSRNQGADHVAIYIGNGRYIEAPRPGLSVQLSSGYDMGQAFVVRIKPGHMHG